MSKFLGAGVVAVAALLWCSCSAVTSANTPAKAAGERKSAPDFTLTDSNGSSVKLSDYRGKVVLLNFWATWCGPCQLEIPWFEEFEQQYKSKGFEVIGIAMDEEGWPVIKPYVTEHKMNYRVVLGNDSVVQLYGGFDALPVTFMIDRDGKFAFSPHLGLAAKNEYLKEIQTLLGIKQTSAARRGVASLPAVLHVGAAE